MIFNFSFKELKQIEALMKGMKRKGIKLVMDQKPESENKPPLKQREKKNRLTLVTEELASRRDDEKSDDQSDGDDPVRKPSPIQIPLPAVAKPSSKPVSEKSVPKASPSPKPVSGKTVRAGKPSPKRLPLEVSVDKPSTSKATPVKRKRNTKSAESVSKTDSGKEDSKRKRKSTSDDGSGKKKKTVATSPEGGKKKKLAPELNTTAPGDKVEDLQEAPVIDNATEESPEEDVDSSDDIFIPPAMDDLD
jgi:hypothetical protein